MIKHKKKICQCGYEGFFPSKKCQKCKYYEKGKQSKKANTSIKKKKTYIYKRKPTGEGELFREIWELRIPHISFVSGVNIDGDAKAWYFSHVIKKGTVEAGRLDKDNIVYMTLQEHELWENHQYKLIDDPKWRHVFHLKHKLLIKYGYSIPPREEHIRKV